MKEFSSMDDDNSDVEGIEYPVEFELRVIYQIERAATIATEVEHVLIDHKAFPGVPHSLPASGVKYGRLACSVRFDDKEALYAAYAAIGALPGVKVVL